MDCRYKGRYSFSKVVMYIQEGDTSRAGRIFKGNELVHVSSRVSILSVVGELSVNARHLVSCKKNFRLQNGIRANILVCVVMISCKNVGLRKILLWTKGEMGYDRSSLDQNGCELLVNDFSFFQKSILTYLDSRVLVVPQ